MLTRREFLFQSAAAAASVRVASALGPPAEDATVAHPPCGALRGALSEGIRVFRGVPFAQPPVGELRYRPPQPLQSWAGVREATRFAAASVQPNKPSIPQSEDCLYLNIWTPEKAQSLPVFVWIHGGGYTGGRSFDPMFDGTEFAKDGVVCITIAYRLGVFGFLDLGPLLGPSYAGSGNNAMRDVMEALRWVQKNIAAFGGDPACVTVGGESAGAKLTDLLMGTPSAKGLFQQMISESGGADRIWPLARAQGLARNFGAEWKAQGNRGLPQLLDAPAGEIIQVQQAFTKASPVHFPLRAEMDGTLVRQSPLRTIREGSTRRKRLLIGTNRDESALFLGPHPLADPAAKDLGNLPLEQFEKIESRYKQLYPSMSDEMRRIRSVTAEEYWIPSMRVTDAHVEGGGTAFVYRFDFPEAHGRVAGYAFHSFELRFVWDHFAHGVVSDDARQFARQMHGAWVSFIQGKAPRAEGLPVWPAYSIPTRPTMLLDRSSHVENAPQAEEFALWDSILTS